MFTRQGLPHQPRTAQQVQDIERGAYVLRDAAGAANAVIIATGSEIALAVAAAEQLATEGIAARVVSMPNPGLFLRQDAAYRESVLPGKLQARVAVEAGGSIYWHAFVGTVGKIIGIDHFGASAPANILFEQFGFTVENVCQAVRDSVSASQP